ncbi:MAG: hypothetical protein WED34_20735 [Planctomycetales bacterium]
MNFRTRIIVTLATAVLLTAAYGLYTATVCPWIAPPPLAGGPAGPSAAPTIIVPPIESRRMAERHLAGHPWTADAKYQLRTAEAFVYFEEWDRVDDDQAVRFRPFAVIWMQEGKADDEPPVTVVCDSAYVKFHSKFEITNNPGRVVAGALEKDVRITGPDGLEIEGRNFVFSESAMRIWSDNHLRFAYGPHTGEGHGMQIELVPAAKIDPRDSLAVSGIRSVRLRRDVKMNLVGEREESKDVAHADVPEGRAGETASGGADPVPGSEQSEPEPTRVYVTSDGSFDYFVEEHKARFQQNVSVRRPTQASGGRKPPGDPRDPATDPNDDSESDSLACDRLTLLFQPQMPAAVAEADSPADAQTAAPDRAAEKKPGRFSNVESRLAFQQLTAEGKLVRLVSDANHLDATMTFLNYDADRRVAVLKEDKAVRVLRDGSEIRSPEITIVHDEAGEVSATVCRGAGWMRYRNFETGDVELAAQWHKQLRVFPETETGLQVIELRERAILKQPRESAGIAAEFIRMWLRKVEPPATGAPGAPPEAAVARRPAAAGMPAGSADYKPVKALVVDQVAIVSPQLAAQTKRLEIWFEESASPLPALPAAEREPRDRLAPAVRQVPFGGGTSSLPGRAATRIPLSPAGGEGAMAMPQVMAAVADPVVKPAAASPSATDDATGAAPPRRRRSLLPDKDEGPQEPVEVVADLIRVRAVEDPATGEMQVAELWTEGKVDVRQKLGPNQPPRRLTGDRIHFVNQAENQELVHVYGKPAHVRDPRMHIEGPEIHLDRGTNRVWVEGAGLLQLPVDRTLEGRELAQPEVLDVWWKEKMTFDGRLALFRGKVRTAVQDNRMRCEEMEVYFDRRVDFSGESERAEEQDPEVERVICRDGVEIESHAYEESRLVGIRRARFWELTIDQKSGDTDASGPGWIVAWSRGSGRRAALGPSATAQANRPLAADANDWEYMRIDFTGRTVGNLHQKHTTFNDRVEIVYGPVERPLVTIDVDHLPREGGWLRCDSLRFTQHEETQEQPAYLELFANGNAELEGREFHARADQITYDESKGLYMLRSLGNREASIWQQKVVGGEFSRTGAQWMEFIPSKNQLRLHRSRGLEALP